MLGYHVYGQGPSPVFVLHDWFCDSQSYEGARPYLAPEYTYYFVDLRGYGLSKGLEGDFTVEEIYSDLIALADHLGHETFHLVTHSMTGLVAQYACIAAPQRLLSVIATTPTPACGVPAMLDSLAFVEGAARHDRQGACQLVSMMTGGRYQGQFLNHKVERWWTCSTPQARVAYAHMFVKTDFCTKVKGCKIPLLVIVGAHDVEGHRLSDMQATIGEWFENVTFQELPSCGHYPMQEVPPLYAQVLECHMKAATA